MMNVFLPPDRFVGRLLPNIVTGARCTQLLRDLDARGFSRTGELYPDDYRNNDRLVFDDAGLAAELEDRVRAYIPDEIVDGGARWKLLELNTRFRACRYANGQSFCVHRDGAYVPSEDVRSFLTVQLYLDDDARRTGGRTRFYADAQAREQLAAIAPSVGSVIIFDHRVWHDGESVTRGIKHVLRTDAVYQRIRDNVIEELGVVRRHRGYVWCAIACRDASIASSGRDGTVRRGNELHDLGDGSITTLVEADDGVLWCGSRAGSIHRIGGGHDVVMTGLGAVLASANSGGLVAFATARGQIVSGHWRVDAHHGWARGLCAHADGFASCGHDGRVVLVDRNGRIREHAQLPTPLRAIVSDGGFIHAGDERGWVHTLSHDGSILRSRRTHAAAVTALAICDDGSVVSAGEDNDVKCGDRVICELRDFVTSIAVTKRGLAVAGYDGAVRLLG